MRTGTLIALFGLAWVTLACASSDFSGGAPSAKKAGSKGKEKTEEPEAEKPDPDDTDTDGKDVTDDKDTAAAAAAEEAKNAPTDLLEQDGVLAAPVNYDACKSLPASGKTAYGKCQENAVVVIVNDGKAQEMTCCPLSGKNIFSKVPAELFVARSGLCQANEVLTGMANTSGGVICSKIYTKYLTLTTSVPSVYVVGNTPGVMGEIAKSYNVSDTCICPEKTVAIGGHTASDNRCGEQCVVIKKK